MNALFEDQQSLQLKISNVFENYKKQDKAKRTKGLAMSFLERLEKLYQQLCDNHSKILRIENVDKTHPYFKNNMFDVIEEVYDVNKGSLLECVENFKMIERTREREADREAANRRLAELSATDLNTTIAHAPSVNVLNSLPKADIPKFSGKFEDWEGFRDLFRSLIHDVEEIPKIVKFQHLKASVQNEAADVIKRISMSDANYMKAWETLVDRYENHRRIVSIHMAEFLAVKPMKAETSTEFDRVIKDSFTPLDGLSAIKRHVNFWDDPVVYIIVNRFEVNTRKEWEKSLGVSAMPPTVEQLKIFAINYLTTLEAVERGVKSLPSLGSSKNSQNNNYNKKGSISSTPTYSLQTNTDSQRNQNRGRTFKCIECNESHALWTCSKFKSKAVADRFELVKTHHFCFRCLNKHPKNTCNYKRLCTICNHPHHTLLHRRKGSENSSSNSCNSMNNLKDEAAQNSQNSSINCSSTFTTRLLPLKQRVILSTALIYVTSSSGIKLLVRALIDQCSQASFISESLCQRLKLERNRVQVPITGVGENTIATSKGITQFEISPRFESKFSCRVEALILPRVSTYKPPRINSSVCSDYLTDLDLADPDYMKDHPIDLLLGSSVHAIIILDKIKKGKVDEPLATSTQLGWLLSGNVPSSSHCIPSPSSHHCFISNEFDLNEIIQNFWRQEEVPNQEILTSDEQACENHFKVTHRRNASGRYVVRLPFKNPENLSADLGESYSIAFRMLKRMEHKFAKDDKLKLAYSEFLKEYEKLEHMSLVKPELSDQNQTKACYLPHHGVWKDSSSTTRLRTVFNGSSKTDSGISVNNLLLTGQNLLPSLIDLICHWRKYKYVFVADVEKMFRQILVDERDQQYQSILWRLNPQDPVKIFRLATITYGLVCSPFLASRVIKQLAADHQGDFPLGAQVLSKEVYMDDVLSGAFTLDEALLKQRETISLFNAGGFPLRKWLANHSNLLEWLPNELRAVDPLTLSNLELTVDVLGISWYPKEDAFHFKVNLPSEFNKITKRSILSNIARIFDPMGWLGPVVISAKILMQSLWLLKVDWDSNLPDEIVVRWSNWHDHLPSLNDIKIPRWINYMPQAELIEVHGFCDASKQAYGAVVYLRVVYNSSVTISIQLAKSRVAPLKTLSIPRLELSAAHLLARLVQHFVKIMNLSIESIHLWTDSLDVLYWLKDHPARWQTFVSNRCSHIHTAVPNAYWHHVRSKQNPADVLSRGIDASQFVHCSLWWSGPTWLSETVSAWPIHDHESRIQIINKPVESVNHPVNKIEPIDQNVNTCQVTVSKPMIWGLVDNYSSLYKLLRITSYCLRFIIKLFLAVRSKQSLKIEILKIKLLSISEMHQSQELVEFISKFCANVDARSAIKSHLLTLKFLDYNCLTSKDKIISVDEIKNAKSVWIYLHQTSYYAKEIELLRSGQFLKPKNPLSNLNPQLINDQLRVGGRISRSLLDDDAKHPLILPDKTFFTTLLIRDAHYRTLHGATQLTLATLRRQVWIIKGRSAVKSEILKCVKCRRYSKSFCRQLMGELPEARVTPSFPFQRSGVDYAGPVSVRLSKTRGKGTFKGFISIFICMSTRAVHIEAVEDYTAEAFIAAFQRFTARRGHCAELFSDRGTNFVGADNNLKSMFDEFSSQFQQISCTLINDGTKWNFNPPGAPHFGGLWEAAVRSAKHHLRRILGDQVLTFVELATLLAKVEACLNSRPLLPLSDDPTDLQYLSPSHFLIQRESFLVPEPDVSITNIPPNKRWQLITQLSQQFWKRWSDEYLDSLQVRSKWRTPAPSLKVGDLVILKGETTPPAKWPIGRVMGKHPGKDGLVRVVTVRTGTSMYKRPIVKTILL